MGRLRWLIAGALLVILVGGFGAWMASRGHQASGGKLVTKGALLTAFDDAGVRVKETMTTNSYAMFGLEPDASLGIRTEAGHLDVVFFPQAVEGRLEVKQLGANSWRIEGWESGPHSLGSNHPLYLTIHQNMFIMAHSEAAHREAQRALDRVRGGHND